MSHQKSQHKYTSTNMAGVAPTLYGAWGAEESSGS